MILRFWKWLIVVLAAAAIVVALRHANDTAADDPSIGRLPPAPAEHSSASA